jgi:mannose-6-phosphate isomerase-like protein (cupin superfamily)
MSDHPKAGLAIGNTQIKVLVAGEETSSRYAITQSTYGPGVGVGLHRHLSFSEINIIAEGQLQGEIDGRRFSSNPGDVVRIPKGSLHNVENGSVEKPVTFNQHLRPSRNG